MPTASSRQAGQTVREAFIDRSMLTRTPPLFSFYDKTTHPKEVQVTAAMLGTAPAFSEIAARQPASVLQTIWALRRQGLLSFPPRPGDDADTFSWTLRRQEPSCRSSSGKAQQVSLPADIGFEECIRPLDLATDMRRLRPFC